MFTYEAFQVQYSKQALKKRTVRAQKKYSVFIYLPTYEYWLTFLEISLCISM